MTCHAHDTRGANERTEESEKQGSILVDPKPQKGAKRSTKRVAKIFLEKLKIAKTCHYLAQFCSYFLSFNKQTNVEANGSDVEQQCNGMAMKTCALQRQQ